MVGHWHCGIAADGTSGACTALVPKPTLAYAAMHEKKPQKKPQSIVNLTFIGAVIGLGSSRSV